MLALRPENTLKVALQFINFSIWHVKLPLEEDVVNSVYQSDLPSDCDGLYLNSDVAVQQFLLIDIFAFQNGRLLPPSPRFGKVMLFAKNYLKKDQARLRKLCFHNEAHTFHPVKGVVSVALKLAILEGIDVDDERYEIIALSAALHDIGNIVQRQKHEQISIDDSRGTLRTLGYNQRIINAVADCIYSTEIDYQSGAPKRQIKSETAKIVSDADLSNPGFHDVTNFAFESIKLWLELGEFSIEEFASKGPALTRFFFENIGGYYTAAAKRLLQKRRDKNLLTLETEVARIMNQCRGEPEQLFAMIAADDERISQLAQTLSMDGPPAFF